MLRMNMNGMGEIKARLERFDVAVQDASPAWESVMKQLEDHAALTFAGERNVLGASGSDHGKWKALTPKYRAVKKKLRPGAKKLVFDGDLRASLTEPGKGIRVIERQFMMYGTDNPVARYHQLGTPKMVKRPFMPNPKSSLVQDIVIKALQRHIVESTNP